MLYKNPKILFLFLCFWVLLFSGCARKPWGTILPNEDQLQTERILRSMQQRERHCFQGIESEIKLTVKSPVHNEAIKGYLLAHAPSSIKLIISNPLGQPVFAFAGNERKFQMLKPDEHLHIRGNMRSFALRNEIPLILAQGNWFAYLTGRLPRHTITVVESAKDTSSDTVWVKINNPAKPYSFGSVYLQIDQNREELISYLFLDIRGDITAEIHYSGERAGDPLCGVYPRISSTQLSWGAEISIELEDISTADKFEKTAFRLPIPKLFRTQLWP